VLLPHCLGPRTNTAGNVRKSSPRRFSAARWRYRITCIIELTVHKYKSIMLRIQPASAGPRQGSILRSMWTPRHRGLRRQCLS
jgi:hypothetical protein